MLRGINKNKVKNLTGCKLLLWWQVEILVLGINNSDFNRLNLMFTVSLSLTVNQMNCVCPSLWDLDINTCFVRIDPTFIAGILLTHISSSGCIYSSQTPTFSQGAEAALSLGGPGREKHMRGRTEEVLGRQSTSGQAVFPSVQCI